MQVSLSVTMYHQACTPLQQCAAHISQLNALCIPMLAREAMFSAACVCQSAVCGHKTQACALL